MPPARPAHHGGTGSYLGQDDVERIEDASDENSRPNVARAALCGAGKGKSVNQREGNAFSPNFRLLRYKGEKLGLTDT